MLGIDIGSQIFVRNDTFLSIGGPGEEGLQWTFNGHNQDPYFGTVLIAAAAYPSTCTNLVTCNRPTSVTDARGNATSYTYDPVHGGVLTETSPPGATGLQAVKRYAYAQRYTWLKNSSGSYATSASPIWVRTEMRTCLTTATVGGACAGGAADEVLTSYDYGPNAGPNTLLQRGAAVTANGVTRRSCYGYDGLGHKISETQPSAGLAVCS